MLDYDMIRFDRLLANYKSSFPQNFHPPFFFRASLSQGELEPLELILDIPGVEKDAVTVDIASDFINIKVEGYAPIRQRISKEVDSSTVRATLRNGRLRISGDLHEKAKPREIEIKTDAR